MSKTPKISIGHGFLPITKEYKQWLNQPYDKHGNKTVFEEIKYRVKLHDINYIEATRFEETLAYEYLKQITEFWKYVTEVCLLAGDYGIELLAAFNRGEFDKKTIYQRKLSVLCIKKLHLKREKKIVKYCKKYFPILQEGF
ncbi:unnamed protein product [Adineta steineri]|uniref:Uncharacterized protein n=1 Tax=Adineta steineri TaxID=433720 RepID=A0A819YAK7_9BILA|nr:unnamed protein product [Adineta steineri]CAF4155614.1 unnamed protein product [Adineta steineri]